MKLLAAGTDDVPTTARPRDRRYQPRPATHFGSYLPVRTDCIVLQGIEVLLQAADVLLHVRNGGAETTHSVSVGPTLAPSTENQTSSGLARDSDTLTIVTAGRPSCSTEPDESNAGPCRSLRPPLLDGAGTWR